MAQTTQDTTRCLTPNERKFVLISIHREIDREQYNRAVENNGHIAQRDQKSVFTASEIYGYGVYYDTVYSKNGRFFVMFNRGESCD